MKLNEIYNMDCIKYMKTLQNECIDLIIADPPYYKTINEKWDKQWRTEKEYLSWTQQWFNECVRILKPTGVFYCYGNFDILSKQKVLIFDKQLNFRQNITLNKGLRAIAGRTSDKLRMFPTASEYLLYYTKQGDIGITTKNIKENNMPFLREYFKNIHDDIGISKSKIIEIIGQKVDHCLRYYSSQWDFPTENTYKSLIKLTKSKDHIEYNELKKIYEKNRYTFNLPIGITDVWEFKPDKVRYGHKTQKPCDITDRIIKSSSNEGQIVFIPFAGSGSEIIGCIKNKRNWIATEINKEYIEKMIKPRINKLQ